VVYTHARAIVYAVYITTNGIRGLELRQSIVFFA
jgi:hypothetical protein